MKCKTCRETIPEARLRILPKAVTCVKCSTEERWSAVPIIHHKTGNTIEVVKDREVAEEFHRLSARAGFGTMRGLRAGVSGGTKTKLGSFGSTAFVGTPEAFNQVGERAMDAYEAFGIEKAEQFVQKSVQTRLISDSQGAKIMRLIRVMNAPADPEPAPKKVQKYNPYSKYEPKQPKPEVSEDIQYIFRNWKR